MTALTKTIKNANMITPEYCAELRLWIIGNQVKYFADNDEADSWGDFERWPDKKTDRNHLIMPGEVCLIDRMWEGRHAYVICQFYGKECRKVRDIALVVYIDELERKHWRNGYFLLPDLSI